MYSIFAVFAFFLCVVNADNDDCGIETVGGRLKRELEGGEVPWHALIYTKASRPYRHICGGTLIRNNVVISNAICFWDENEKKHTASKYAVAVGKLYRFWGNEDDVNAQKSDVKEINIPPQYKGLDANYQDDIAVLITAVPFVYTIFVRPICLSFDADLEKQQLKTGSVGKVPGFGLEMGQIIQTNELPYLDVEACIAESPEYWREFVTEDKFCAKSQPPTSVICRGDIGNGLAFPELDNGVLRYYLRGVVSTAPNSEDENEICSTKPSPISFGQISKHESFIKKFISM